MKWKKKSGSSHPETAFTLLLRGPLTIGTMAAVAVLGALLAPKIPVAESERIATPEKMTSQRLKSFIEVHSWLDYTTRDGDTLEEVARRLRLGSPDRLREENPSLADTGADEPLAAGLVLKVRYNDSDALFRNGEE